MEVMIRVNGIAQIMRLKVIADAFRNTFFLTIKPTVCLINILNVYCRFCFFILQKVKDNPVYYEITIFLTLQITYNKSYRKTGLSLVFDVEMNRAWCVHINRAFESTISIERKLWLFKSVIINESHS